MNWRWLAFFLVCSCAGTSGPQPQAADDVAAPGGTGSPAEPPPPPKPRTLSERLAAVSRVLDGVLTAEAVAEIFESPALPTESPYSFRIELPDDGGSILINLATEESPQRGVLISDVPSLRFDTLIRLYGKRYEVLRGAKEGAVVIFDATQAGWPYGLYVSAQLKGAARPRAVVRSLELHYAH